MSGLFVGIKGWIFFANRDDIRGDTLVADRRDVLGEARVARPLTIVCFTKVLKSVFERRRATDLCFNFFWGGLELRLVVRLSETRGWLEVATVPLFLDADNTMHGAQTISGDGFIV